MSTAMPSAAATGSAVCTARRWGLLTSRRIGNRASAPGSRRACSQPSSVKLGIGAFAGLCAQRQRMPDQQEQHACNDKVPVMSGDTSYPAELFDLPTAWC